ncbi:hypothetical protein U1Q18_041704 [Sarracenia purpurea var. burkii]
MMVSAAAQFIRCSAIPSMGLDVAAQRGGCAAQRGGWFRRSECSARLSSLIQFVGNTQTEMPTWRGKFCAPDVEREKRIGGGDSTTWFVNSSDFPKSVCSKTKLDSEKSTSISI